MPYEDLAVFVDWFRRQDRATIEDLAAVIPYEGAVDLVRGYMDVFRALGLLSSDGRDLRLAHEPRHASAFFRAICDLLLHGNYVFGPLESDTDTWLQILRAIEQRRLRVVQRDIEHWKAAGITDIADRLEGRVRKQVASAMVLVGVWENVPHVLLEFDPLHWRRYRLVGGKRRRPEVQETIEPPLETILRELREELDTQVERVLTFDGATGDAFVLDVSRRLGELTYYTFHLFQPVRCSGRPLTYDGTQKQQLWWLPVADVLAAAARRDDLLFHELLDNSVTRMLLTSPRSSYQLDAQDAARIRIFGAAPLAPPS